MKLLKSMYVYQLKEPVDITRLLELGDDGDDEGLFKKCTVGQISTMGFSPIIPGIVDSGYYEDCGLERYVFRLTREERKISSTQLNTMMTDWKREYLAVEGNMPNRKEVIEQKEFFTAKLLKESSFSTFKDLLMVIDLRRMLIIFNTTGTSLCEHALALVRGLLGSLPVTPYILDSHGAFFSERLNQLFLEPQETPKLTDDDTVVRWLKFYRPNVTSGVSASFKDLDAGEFDPNIMDGLHADDYRPYQVGVHHEESGGGLEFYLQSDVKGCVNGIKLLETNGDLRDEDMLDDLADNARNDLVLTAALAVEVCDTLNRLYHSEDPLGL